MRRTVNYRSLQRTCASLLLLAAAQTLRADWFRDFDDGTTQGLIEWDMMEIMAGINEFSIYAVDGALRMDFNGICPIDPNNNSGGVYDSEVFETVSARMLIKWSVNPALDIDDGILNAGWTLRYDPNLGSIKGYTFYLSNIGELELGRLFFNTVAGKPDYQTLQELWITGFSPLYDWWLVAECISRPSGGVTLRAKVWQDGTPESCDWIVEQDLPDAHPPGMVAVGADEDPETGDGQFVDVDHLAVTSVPTCTEDCSNGLDDDLDGRTDCADPDCGSAPHCQCPAPFADLDQDGDVDQDDFGAWQRCFTGAGVLSAHDDFRCDCLDRDDMDTSGTFDRFVDGDGDIDSEDFSAFVKCVSGPAIPADPNCDS